MDKVYYYKRENGDIIFSQKDNHGERHTLVMSEERGEEYLRMLREMKKNLECLFLDIPEDFQTIKYHFFNRIYWEDWTWQDEYMMH